MYPNNIKSVHIELTNKCQASCPMCARNYYGGAEREYLKLDEITLDKFKSWFPIEFIKQLTNFYACGNYGDPIIAQDCLEIFKYIREHNKDTRLAMHTNGSARSADWWKNLARVLGKNSMVVFGIDGFKGQHEIYRRGTNFDKIIENAKAFISEGGSARADSLVFEHNESSVRDLEKFLLGIGFEHVNFKTTKRFYGKDEFPVQDKNGNFEYNLKSAKTSEWKQEFKINIESLRSKTFLSTMKKNAIIEPECIKLNQVYVDTHGNFLPCCWVGFDYVDELEKDDGSAFTSARNNMVQESKLFLKELGIPNLNNKNILETLKDDTLWSSLPDIWNSENKPLACVKTCSTTLYDTLYAHTVKKD